MQLIGSREASYVTPPLGPTPAPVVMIKCTSAGSISTPQTSLSTLCVTPTPNHTVTARLLFNSALQLAVNN